MASSPIFNEKALLNRLRDGDAHAFTQIYDHYKEKVGYRLLRLLKSEELAEEIQQNLFMKIWENRWQIDPDKAFKSYLYRIAENMVFDTLRRANKEKDILKQIIRGHTELHTHVEEALFRKENEIMLNLAIDRLPPQRKKIFIAIKIDNKSYQEVADDLGISTNTVNDHIQKASQFLKKYFGANPKLYLSLLLLIYLL